MWWLVLFLLVPAVGAGLLFYFRQHPILRVHLQRHDILNEIGLQINDHVYTLRDDLHTSETCLIDIVFIKKHADHYRVRRLFHPGFKVEITHVPVGHRLKHVRGNQEHALHYMPGSPFRVADGDLVLLEQRRRSMGFTYHEVKRAKSWPMK